MINFLTARLRIKTAHWQRNPAAMNRVLESLQRHKALMITHCQRTSTTLDVVRQQGPRNWARFDTTKSDRQPSSPSPGKMSPSRKLGLNPMLNDLTRAGLEGTPADLATAQLRTDYEDILERTDALIRAYSEGMEDIHKSAMLLESRKAIEQSKGVARLTLLAFLFIPLSFTSSFFGMNFKELWDDRLSVWVWFITSLPIFAIAAKRAAYQRLTQQ